MLQKYLPSVLKYSQDNAEVWVADNASTDNSLKVLKDEFPEVHTIVLDRNYGFAEGYNKALQQVDAGNRTVLCYSFFIYILCNLFFCLGYKFYNKNFQDLSLDSSWRIFWSDTVYRI